MSRTSADAVPTTSTSQQTVQPTGSTPSEEQTTYSVKWVLNAQQTSVPILMQNHNGPCALLALVNANFQTGALHLRPGITTVSQQHLMSMLIELAMSTNNADSSDAVREHAVNDFIEILPGLTKGVDINVRFNDITAFEFTRELGVFDIFPNIRLVHGWLFDPQDTRLAIALNDLSYNQVIDELVRTEIPAGPPPPPSPSISSQQLETSAHELDIENNQLSLAAIPSAPLPEDLEEEESEDQFKQGTTDEIDADSSQQESPYTEVIRDARPRVVEFLEMNPTQLTVYGLLRLHENLNENETAILFRNSHFSVIKKHRGAIYNLISDVGFLQELNTVWEQLSDVTGASSFYNGAFQRLNDDGSVPASRSKQTLTQQTPQNRNRPSQTDNCNSAAARRPTSASSTRLNNVSHLRYGRGSSSLHSSSKDKGCIIQ